MLRDSYLNKETDSFGVRTLEEVFGSQNTNQDMDEHPFSDFTEDSIRSQLLDRSLFYLPAKQREFDGWFFNTIKWECSRCCIGQ